MKKILILTVTAGGGHNSAASAIKERLLCEDCEVKTVNIIKEYSNKFNSWNMDKGYALAVGYARHIYNMFYRSYLKRDYVHAPVCPMNGIEKDIYGKLLKTIYEFKPDVIFCTAYYAAIALENLKRCYPIPSFNLACMLDYVVSPFWEAGIEGLNYLTLSTDYFRPELIRRGYNDSQLIETGIPIRSGFFEHCDKAEARRKLGLKDKFTVLIFYGGGYWHGGYEVLSALTKRIKYELQIVIVNGNDKKTKLRIDKKLPRYPKHFDVCNLGFRKDIPLIMSACDLMIGKGGGLSTTEALISGLPLLVTEKLPMQEIYNVRFLTQRKVAASFGSMKELADIVEGYIVNPEKIKVDFSDSKELSLNGTENIAKLILAQPSASYDGIAEVDYSVINKEVKAARIAEYKRRKKLSKSV